MSDHFIYEMSKLLINEIYITTSN